MTDHSPLTPTYLESAAKVLGWIQNGAYIFWLDDEDTDREGTLRGWNSREDDIRDRRVRVTMRSGMEAELGFDELVQLAVARRVALRVGQR